MLRSSSAMPSSGSRRRLVALFAIFGLLLCAFVIHAMNANAVHTERFNSGIDSEVIAVTAPGSSGALVGGTTGTLLDDSAVCIGECNEYSADAIACLLTIAITGLLIYAVILQVLKLRMRDTTVLIIAPSLARPRPMTPSLQELSIIRI